jgi:hypothetical protein
MSRQARRDAPDDAPRCLDARDPTIEYLPENFKMQKIEEAA